MTITAVVPVVRYTSDGVLTQYFWNWQMLEESAIEVRVANLVTTAYTENENNIIFHEPPVAGADIVIFRRTTIWQLENYTKFRGFKADKTELTMDRATVIAQEYEAGVVGAADLFLTLWGHGITVNSERGRDAFIPVWGDIPPDSSIIWAGEAISAYNTSVNPLAITQIIFWAFNGGGQLGQSNASYAQSFNTLFAGWLNFENPNPAEYWMRIRQTGNPAAIDGGQEFSIVDGGGTPRTFDEEFDPRNTVIELKTTTAVPPAVSLVEMLIDICKDDGFGAPDGLWATREVSIALEYTI